MRRALFIVTVLLGLQVHAQQSVDTNSAKYLYNQGLRYYYCPQEQMDIAKTIHYWERAAHAGSVEAAYGLGLLYEMGELVPENSAEALKWFGRAAELGDMYAQYTVGIYLNEGFGCQPNPDEALKMLKLAARQNYAPAMRQIGIILESRIKEPGKKTYKAYQEVVDWYSMAARLNDAVAQYLLANIHFDGKGGYFRSLGKAVMLYKQSAENGFADAQYSLGYCYYYGVGLEHDEVTAVRWLRLAAGQGVPDAQYMLGCIYYDNRKVPGNFDTAYAYIREAAEQGVPDALYRLGVHCFYGRGVEQDVAKARELWLKADSVGVLSARYALGALAYFGIGQDQDYAKAHEYWMAGAKKGNPMCQYGVGVLYYMGQSVAQSYDSAYAWFQRSAKGSEYPYANYMLGVCSEFGQGCGVDMRTAKNYYLQAAYDGHVESMYSVARAYYKAGMVDDADQWLDAAVEMKYQPAIEFKNDLAKDRAATLRNMKPRKLKIQIDITNL